MPPKAGIGEIVIAPLSRVYPSRYQSRPIDPTHAQELAEEFRKNGMTEYPVARPRAEGGFELVVGHHRREAFIILANEGLTEFNAIPLIVRNFSDEEAFTAGLTENLKRKKLSPMQRARSIKAAQDNFGWSSAKVSEVFAEAGESLSPSAVRNILSLLRLPVQIQDMIDVGKITELEARRLTGFARLKPEQAVCVAEKISGGTSVDDAVGDAVRYDKDILEMWAPWRGTPAVAGPGLFGLDWIAEPKLLPALVWRNVRHVKQIQSDRAIVENMIRYLGEGETVEDLVKDGLPENEVEILAHLLAPSTCNKCPHHFSLNGTHWCGLRLCHQRKTKAWTSAELHRLTKETGIPPYQESDGEYRPLLRSTLFAGGKPEPGKDEKDFSGRAGHLRLVPTGAASFAHGFTNSHVVQVVALEAGEASAKGGQATPPEQPELTRSQQAAMEDNKRRATLAYIWEIAAPVFGATFDPFSSKALPVLIDALASATEPPAAKEEPGAKEDAAQLRRMAAFRLIYATISRDHYAIWYDGPEATARYLKGLAKALDIALPGSWVKDAAAFERTFEDK
jgi:ParB/RepB/Spo0J family partition protein